MADILISKFTTQIPRVGATPATPGFAESEGQDPVAPSGTPQVYTPVTIGSPANGLSISGTQVLTIGLASTSDTGALSSTDWNTFNNKLNLTSPITGYTVGANTALAATDTILQAFGKVQGQINARISGTIASGQVAFGTGVNTVGGDAGFTYDSANDRFTIGGASLFGNNNIDFISSATSQIYATSNTGVAEPFQVLGNLVIAPRTNASLSTYFVTNNGSNINWRWRIISSGILESRESNSIVTRTGNLNIRSDAGNGSIIISPNGTGGVTIGPSTTPTNTLDVNGTARIRTISNLGTAATSVLVPSATGVVSLRTLAELASDMGTITLATGDARYLRKDQSDNSAFGIGLGMTTSIGTNTLLVRSITTGGNAFFTLQYPSGDIAVRQMNDGRFQIFNSTGSARAALEVDGTPGGSIAATFIGVGPTTANGVVSIKNSNASDRRTLAILTSTDVRTIELYSGGTIFHARSSGSDRSVRRDELYLNYSQTVATAGTLNDLAINADCKLLILTGAADLTGVVPVDNGRLLRIEARTASRIIRHESASSTATNRFSIGADLTINAGEVYQFIYTDSRWRFINDTRDQFAVKTTATADQTLPSGTLTILDYDSTLLNNSTNTYTVGTDGRITINRTGIYTITAGVVIEADAVTALESAFLGIFRNGDLVAISSINTTIAAGAQSGLSTSTILSLTATDIIDCRALVNSVGGVANGLARRLGTLLGANATQVNSLSITKNSM